MKLLKDCAARIPLYTEEVSNWASWRTIGIAIGAALSYLVPACASLIDVTNASTVVLLSGQQLAFDVSIANFASNNPGAPVPGQLNLQLMAPANQGAMATLPGSTAQYYSGYQISGQVVGSSGWFQDAAAARAGFDGGLLLLGEGWLSTGGGSQAIGIVNGGAYAPDLDVVRILLTNMGADLTLGAGDGYTLRSSFLLAVSGASGTAQTTGLVQHAFLLTPDASGGALPIPEPGTAALLLAATVLLFRYHYFARAWKNRFSKTGCTSTSSR